jgi:hypothetical protein
MSPNLEVSTGGQIAKDGNGQQGITTRRSVSYPNSEAARLHTVIRTAFFFALDDCILYAEINSAPFTTTTQV